MSKHSLYECLVAIGPALAVFAIAIGIVNSFQPERGRRAKAWALRPLLRTGTFDIADHVFAERGRLVGSVILLWMVPAILAAYSLCVMRDLLLPQSTPRQGD